MRNSSNRPTAAARSLRVAEQEVVCTQLRDFERSHPAASFAPARLQRTPSNGKLDASTVGTSTVAPAASPTQLPSTTASPTMLRLLRAPLAKTAAHGERAVLAETMQVRKAVTWLRECPNATLQQLQQRVLCATEALFTQLVGMPAAARALLQLSANPHKRDAPQSSISGTAAAFQNAEEAADPAAPVYVMPPSPLTFTEFLSTFLRENAVPASAPPSSTSAYFRGVLLTGRPQPVAPLSSLHVPYGLHLVEDVLRPVAASSPSSVLPSAGESAAAAAVTGLEGHQALLSEVVHWATFFESVFDNAREGLCRDPLNFYAAVLLACAERGAWELRNAPDTLAEEAVRHLHLSDGSTGRRPDVCVACQTEAVRVAERCRTYVRHTLLSMHGDASGRASPLAAQASARTRFFLATPTVVWWAAAFLRLYRLHTPIAATTSTDPQQKQQRADRLPETALASQNGSAAAAAQDEVSCAEAYLLRDWIAQASKADRDVYAAQEVEGSLRIPLSCATHAPVAVFNFTCGNVQAALTRMSALIDSSVTSGAPLRVQELLGILQDDFPVVPYYLSYFSSA